MNTDRANAKAVERLKSPACAALLWSLTLLFGIRVLGQMLQRWWPQPYLPSFDAFQGSGLHYPVLLSAQVIILALMVRAASRVWAGTLNPGPGLRRFLAWFGALYMAGSVLRIVIGLALPAAPRWFKVWIPEFFHLVLAAFVITLVLYCRRLLSDSSKSPGV